MSYSILFFHVVFRTWRSQMTIPIAHERELYAYIMGLINNMGGTLMRIGGMPDHLHILLSLPPQRALSDVMRDLKQSTSKWLKANPHFPQFVKWGEGFAAFTVGRTEKEMIRQYIINQKAHHVSEQFADEYRRLILEHGGTINEQYFLNDD